MTTPTTETSTAAAVAEEVLAELDAANGEIQRAGHDHAARAAGFDRQAAAWRRLRELTLTAGLLDVDHLTLRYLLIHATGWAEDGAAHAAAARRRWAEQDASRRSA